MLADSIPDCRAASVSWLSDNSGFYYTRYPAVGEVAEGDEVLLPQALTSTIVVLRMRTIRWYSEMDDPRPTGPEQRSRTTTATSWSSVFLGWTHTQVYVLDRTTGAWRTINEETEATFEGEVAGGKLYLLTDLDAENKRVVAVDLASRGPVRFEEVVPEDAEAPIDEVALSQGYLAVGKLRNVISEVEIYDIQGNKLSNVPLPIGSVYSLSGNQQSPDFAFGFSSFFIPPRVNVYAPASGELSVFDEVESDLDVDAYEVQQVKYPSKDGTEVPMFIAHKKGIPMDGTNPALIYAYGCYGSVTRPGFQRNRFLWMEEGGVYALAGIRGGGGIWRGMAPGWRARTQTDESGRLHRRRRVSHRRGLYQRGQARKPWRKLRRNHGRRGGRAAPGPVPRGASQRGAHGHGALPGFPRGRRFRSPNTAIRRTPRGSSISTAIRPITTCARARNIRRSCSSPRTPTRACTTHTP